MTLPTFLLVPPFIIRILRQSCRFAERALQMLQIRPDQWTRLKEDARAQFEADMQAHLRSRFPERVAEVGDAALVDLVGEGIARAEQYGIVTRMDVRRFLEFMMELGSDFDTDPALDWARQILDDPADSGSRKMDRLDNHATFRHRR